MGYSWRYWTSCSIASTVSISAPERLWSWTIRPAQAPSFRRSEPLQKAFFPSFSLFGAFVRPVVLGCPFPCKDDLSGGSRTFFLSACFLSLWRSNKQHSSMVECTCCLMNPATARVNDGLETLCLTIALVNVSDCDHPSKDCNMTSSTFFRLNNSINTVSGNWTDSVLTPLDAASSSSWSKLTRVPSICVWTSTWVCYSEMLSSSASRKLLISFL